MAAGRAKLRHRQTGKRIAIGNGAVVYWCDAYNHNPYLVHPKQAKHNVEWVFDYPGHRPYINYPKTRHGVPTHNGRARLNSIDRWLFRENHRPEPAEIFFSHQEKEFIDALRVNEPYVIIEPHIKAKAPPGKRWPFENYQRVVDELRGTTKFIQFDTGYALLDGVHHTKATFREALTWLAGARAFFGPEGGLHHAAAATNTQAVVIFGPYIGPETTGYDTHTNLVARDPELLGWRGAHPRIAEAMKQITPQRAAEALVALL